MQQDQNIKGFTILELLVVITIVAIVSAVAYPNFSDWRQDRELRAAMEKASTMLSSVNTLSQRGNYPFVQFRVTPNGTSSTKFVSKGMDATSLSIKLNNARTIECNTSSGSYWDNNQVDETTKKISTHISKDGAVCFSKDGSYFKAHGTLKNNLNVTVENRSTNQYLILCTTSNASNGGKCPLDQGGGLEKPAYLVEWTRFGNISKFKWSGSDWTRQN